MKGSKVKDILKKQLISICVVIMLSCTMFTNYAHAGVGGVLLSPIIDFTAFIGDTVLFLIQETVLGTTGVISLSDVDASADTVEDDLMMHKFADLPAEMTNGTINTGDNKLEVEDADMDHGFWGLLSYKYPTIYISPAEIFSGRVEMFDIDFISSVQEDGSKVPAKALHNTIAKWYATLRNFALAGMLCVLIYVGIRIIISSTAKDSSKYKSLLTNWLVAMCLLFFIHYLILLMVTVTKEITYLFSTAADGSNYVKIVVKGGEASGGFVTNQIGLARFLVQYNKLSVRTAYLLIYIALVGFTFYYSFIYIKRTLMMALLTLTAPIICLMYPIDTIADGKAQSFKSWFNELLYTCLLQPLHLILYTIFVGGATQLAMSNPLYSVAVLFFMIPAEKFFKDILGFSRRAPKVGASPAIAGALGGLAAGQAKKMLMGGATGKKDKSGSGDGSGDGSGTGSGKIRQNKNNTQSGNKNSAPKTKEEYTRDYEIFKKKAKNVIDKSKTTQGRIDLYDAAMDKVKQPFTKAKNKVVGAGKSVKSYFTDSNGDFSLDKLGRDAYIGARKTGAAAKKAIKATPKTVLKAGGKVYGAYAGAILGAGYAALKGDADPSQEMLGGAVGGLLVGGKLASNLTPSAVASATSGSNVDLSGTDFKKIGKQIGDGVADAINNVNISAKVDLNGLESAINSSLGAGYSVDKMGLQTIVNQLNSSGQLDGTSGDLDKIVDALKDSGNGLQLHTATGDVDFSAKINTDVLSQQLKDSLGNFEIEKLSLNSSELSSLKTQLDNQLQISGKTYLEVDDSSLKNSLNDITFKPGADMSNVRKQFTDQVSNAETKLKDA